MQTLGLLKQFSAEALHERVNDTRLSFLFPRWATQVVHRINSYSDWRWNEAFEEFTYPANGILYLPEHVDHPISIYPSTNISYTGGIPVIDAKMFDAGRPDYTIDGEIRLVDYGAYDVELDNPGANQIVATGVVADQGMVLIVEGRDANGRSRRETMTVGAPGTATSVRTYEAGEGGVRRAAIVTAATAAVAPAWGAGDIVISSGGVTIATIDSPFRNSVSCRRTQLFGTSGAIPVRYSRRHRPLVRDTDVVEVPQEFEEVVELGLMVKIALFKKQADEAGAYKAMQDGMLEELKAWDNRQPAREWVPTVKER